MYAIIQTGGRQYKVSPGDVIEVNRLPVEVGQTIDLPDVRLIGDGPQTQIGRPVVPGAVVRAEVRSNFRSPKIIVFKYKSKVRYRKFNTHRQDLTRLVIRGIYPEGFTEAEATAAPAVEEPTLTPATESGAPVAAATAEAAPEAVELVVVETPSEAGVPEVVEVEDVVPTAEQEEE